MALSIKLVEVLTEYGPIWGCKKESVLGREYYSFQGIPYMKPPIGALTFRDPQPPDNWTDPKNCTEQGSPFCNVNFINGKYEGELDAMFINVYTNNVRPTRSFPVMVWIHAGGIFTGNGTTEVYGPDYLMQKDVVLVTFQYRLGVFGFLSLDDPTLNIPGNAQFRDHIFALKWIQRNIKRFGGDPTNVTLFGESWGAGATGIHMLSEKSRGLFHKAILMSGSALNSIYSLLPRRQWALRLCFKLGYSGPTDDVYLLEFLEKTDPKAIVLASIRLLSESEMSDENFIAPFGPTIEPYDNGNMIICDTIIQMARTCWGNEIDILIGATSNEGSAIEALAENPEEYKKITNFNRYIHHELGLKLDDKKRAIYKTLLLRNYYGQLQPAKTNLEGLMFLSVDASLWHPISRIVKSRANSRRGGQSYVYRFDIDSENNLAKRLFKVSEKYREPTHGDDVFYIFKSTLGPAPAIESPGFDGIKLMLSIYTEFALSGNPNVPELGYGVEWEPATFYKPLKGININEKKCEVIDFPEGDRIKVFDEIYHDHKKDLY